MQWHWNAGDEAALRAWHLIMKSARSIAEHDDRHSFRTGPKQTRIQQLSPPDRSASSTLFAPQIEVPFLLRVLAGANESVLTVDDG